METGYSPNNGEYSIQLGTPTTDNDNRQSAPQLVQLVAGGTVIGHVIVDSGHIIVDSGAITETNSAAILADLATLAGAVSAGKVLTTETNSATMLADLAILAGAISSSVMQSNLKNIGGIAAQMATADGVVQTNVLEVLAGLYNAGGQASSTGVPQGQNVDRELGLLSKKSTSATITSTTAGDAAITYSVAPKTVTTGQAVVLTGSGTSETVIITQTGITSSTTVFSTLTNVVNTGQTSANWDVFSADGASTNGMLATGLRDVIIGMVDPNSSAPVKYRNLQAASKDGLGVQNTLAVNNTTFNGSTDDRFRGNNDNISLAASAARTGTLTITDQTNYNWRGVVICVDTTVVPGSAPSNVVTINGKDPVSGKYQTLLTGAAITGVGTVFYTIYPGATAAANLTVSYPLPRTYQVIVTVGNANSATYSVGAAYIL